MFLSTCYWQSFIKSIQNTGGGGGVSIKFLICQIEVWVRVFIIPDRMTTENAEVFLFNIKSILRHHQVYQELIVYVQFMCSVAYRIFCHSYDSIFITVYKLYKLSLPIWNSNINCHWYYCKIILCYLFFKLNWKVKIIGTKNRILIL